jgi:hypothetical protein
MCISFKPELGTSHPMLRLTYITCLGAFIFFISFFINVKEINVEEIFYFLTAKYSSFCQFCSTSVSRPDRKTAVNKGKNPILGLKWHFLYLRLSYQERIPQPPRIARETCTYDISRYYSTVVEL